ncbi:MAG: asparagine synthase (glutamine-hydrolyzing) [Actinomycetota bacterium]|nr:asparagine synthase (glutamine-hydrolyzing) [Actinomycetota bacterium]
MCGIAGIVNRGGRPADRSVLGRMTTALAHRGPDGQGLFVDGPVGLGHRRLAIIDPSPAGAQPMASDDGRTAITYNGAVYNFPSLRDELVRLGYAFRSRTDTEVVLNAWHAWGPACISRFNGMFAFAVLDTARNSVYLVRDRYGIKPLYWCVTPQGVLFGSEQRSLRASPSCPSEPDLKGYVEYFTFQNILSDRTLVDGIRLLPAGSYLRIDLAGTGEPELTRYWDFDFSPCDSLGDEREYEEELDRLLRQAVGRQLVADVDVGAYLSGGMDSGALSAIASTTLPGLPTFTVGFDMSSASGLELGFDERARAELMSAHLGSEHYEVVLKAGDMERALGPVTDILEEPRVGQSYPNYYAARLASRFVKVVLTGIGSDELFAGYPWRYYVAARSESFSTFMDQYFVLWNRLLPGVPADVAFAPIWNQVRDYSARDVFTDVFRGRTASLDSPSDFVNQCLYFDAKVFLGGLLVVEDKLSMAQALESRVPFLDNDLVDFALTCPTHYKLSDPLHLPPTDHNALASTRMSAYDARADGKRLLRRVMGRYLPHGIETYQKQGFSGPDSSWFKGPSMELVRNRLLDPTAPVYAILDYRAVSALITEHLAGTSNHRLLIWSLLTTNEALS